MIVPKHSASASASDMREGGQNTGAGSSKGKDYTASE